METEKMKGDKEDERTTQQREPEGRKKKSLVKASKEMLVQG